MAFTQKLITTTFDLANGQFEGGGNTATVTGLRTSAFIKLAGGPEQSTLELGIYGLPLSMMNQLSNVGAQYNKDYPNGITVSAGDENGMTTVFQGQIYTAFVDAQDMPQVAFRVSAKPGYFDRIKPVPAQSIKGSGDVPTMMKSLAGQMGLTFENAGVTAKLANPYYPGTAWQQAAAIAQDAGIDWLVHNGTLMIMQPGTARQGSSVPLISKDTGMVGYPAFNQNTIITTALFNPEVKYNGKVQIKSDLTSANGTFLVNNLEYELESIIPHGRWFMTIYCYTAGTTQP